jgi:hypothetical protein
VETLVLNPISGIKWQSDRNNGLQNHLVLSGLYWQQFVLTKKKRRKEAAYYKVERNILREYMLAEEKCDLWLFVTQPPDKKVFYVGSFNFGWMEDMLSANLSF